MRTTLLRQLRLILVAVLGYLLEVCALPYFTAGSAAPSLLVVVLAIITVGYNRFRSLWTGMCYGIVMEVMLPDVPMLNLLFYPVTTLLCSVFFADKSAARLQQERNSGRAGRNISPYLRTPFCAMMQMTLYEVVHVFYLYLGGAELGGRQLGNSISSILLTTLLAVVLMWPVRRILGFGHTVEETTPGAFMPAGR